MKTTRLLTITISVFCLFALFLSCLENPPPSSKDSTISSIRLLGLPKKAVAELHNIRLTVTSDSQLVFSKSYPYAAEIIDTIEVPAMESFTFQADAYTTQNALVYSGQKEVTLDSMEYEEVAISMSLALTPPEFSTEKTQDSIFLGESYQVLLPIDAPRGIEQTYALVEGPAGMILNQDTITWTPADTGSYPVVATVTDEYGQGDTLSWVVAISFSDVLMFTKTDMLDSIVLGNEYRDALEYTLPATGAPNCSLLTALPGMTLVNKEVIWTPAVEGDYNVSAEVYDEFGRADTLSWVVRVFASNQPPFFTVTAGEMKDFSEAGQLYIDTVHAVDPNGDAISFSLVDSTPGMVIIDSVITWNSIDTGRHTVSVEVVDEYGLADTLIWYIDIITADTLSPNTRLVSHEPGQTVFHPYVVIRIASSDPSGVVSVVMDNDTLVGDTEIYTTTKSLIQGINYFTVLSQDGSINRNVDTALFSIVYEPPSGMVLINSKGTNTILMGKNISFTYDYWIDMTEVTQREFAALIDTNGLGIIWSDSLGRGENFPAYGISWFDAVLYCNARSKNDNLDTVYKFSSISAETGLVDLNYDLTRPGYRLPTEAEWEFACGNGVTTEYFWGEDTSLADSYTWFFGNSEGSTHPVATKLPNELGLFDICGNVSEWCNNWNGYDTSNLVDPMGPPSGYGKVIRGGNFQSRVYDFRIARWGLGYSPPNNRLQGSGLRVVLANSAEYYAPQIVTHPQSQLVDAGGRVNFTVSVDGHFPWYQWQRNEIDIPDANSTSYSMAPVFISDSNTKFRCIVCTDLGCDTSNEATISLNPLPSYTTLAWSKVYGDSNSQVANSVAVTTDGGYITVGSTSSAGHQNSDAQLIKWTAQGEVIWEKSYGGPLGDAFSSVILAHDNGYIIGGRTANSSAGEYDLTITKVDENGNKQWSQMVGGEYGEFHASVTLSPDGGYLLSGSSNSYPGGAAFVVKYDGNGNKLWEKSYGGQDNDYFNDSYTTADSGYIFAGYTHKHQNITEGWGGFIVKTDKLGNVMWSNAFDFGMWDLLTSIAEIPGGGYFTAGYGNGSIILLKIDLLGNLIWSKNYGSTGPLSQAEDLLVTNDGHCVITGITGADGNGGYDFFILKTDINGTLIWFRTFGGLVEDRASSVAETPDGGFIIAGKTASMGSGASDIYLIKTDANGQAPPPH